MNHCLEKREIARDSILLVLLQTAKFGLDILPLDIQ